MAEFTGLSPALAVVVVVLLGAAQLEAAPGKLPESIERCKQSDPQFESCLKKAVSGALPQLAKGLPSLGLMPNDPLRISSMHIGTEGGPVGLSLDFTDVDFSGVSNAIVKSVKVDTKKPGIHLSATIPIVSLTGPYKVGGKVLLLPISGQGACNLTLTDVEAEGDLEGEFLKKGDETYMKVNQFILKISPKRLHVDLENLFNGDKALGDNMNKFLNENWEDVLRELKPYVEEAFGETFKLVSNNILQKVPFNQIFLE